MYFLILWCNIKASLLSGSGSNFASQRRFRYVLGMAAHGVLTLHVVLILLIRLRLSFFRTFACQLTAS
jgi:hypothetical protein